MADHLCPWWVGHLLANPIRRLLQDPEALLGPLLSEGDTFLDLGSAMGFFTLPATQLVGPEGRVIAVDLQERMLASLGRRARRRGLADRIELRTCGAESLEVEDLAGQVDLALAFAVVHEVPAPQIFLGEVIGALAPSGQLLLVEPSGHVSEGAFQKTLELAAESGLKRVAEPSVWRSHTALLRRESQ